MSNISWQLTRAWFVFVLFSISNINILISNETKLCDSYDTHFCHCPVLIDPSLSLWHWLVSHCSLIHLFFSLWHTLVSYLWPTTLFMTPTSPLMTTMTPPRHRDYCVSPLIVQLSATHPENMKHSKRKPTKYPSVTRPSNMAWILFSLSLSSSLPSLSRRSDSRRRLAAEPNKYDSFSLLALKRITWIFYVFRYCSGSMHARVQGQRCSVDLKGQPINSGARID